MPFAEIIYETGNKSVAFYDTEEEMKSALSEHHRRAVNGEPATPFSTTRSDLTEPMRVGSWVAERVKKVLLYDKHPADFGQDQLIDVKEAKKQFDKAVTESEMNGVVHVPTVAAAVRDMSSPLAVDPKVHDSQYKAPETSELDLDFLGDAA